ncbi:MAG: KOW motif-containing protein [Candidatus Ancillula sp.]|jgi:transcriptional antiterminator NusG|nr:KOW motif-containing protein [Candidatus Ancillula sp.]
MENENQEVEQVIEKTQPAEKTPLDELREGIADAPFTWVLVRTYMRREKSAANNIKSKIESIGLDELVYEIVIPEEGVIELNENGEKKRVVRMRTPGHILLNMDVNDETLVREIRRTNDVVGYTGDYTPVPLSVDDVYAILAPIVEKTPQEKKTVDTKLTTTAGTKASGVKVEMKYVVGEVVEVTDGPFKGITGTISEIELEHERVQVLISAFGRETPVDLKFNQIRKQGN